MSCRFCKHCKPAPEGADYCDMDVEHIITPEGVKTENYPRSWCGASLEYFRSKNNGRCPHFSKSWYCSGNCGCCGALLCGIPAVLLLLFVLFVLCR